ncbi:MAG TPA: hypothetical protein VG603_03505 [Chitinophagales bacterium]|nr:hypothetical protein [Chitinophagales bacterium]
MANFYGDEGTFITLSDGSVLTAAFRKVYPSQPKGYFFGRNKLNDILAQTDCEGIRIYFGRDTSGNLTLVLVGADSSTNDQCSGYILDNGIGCPPTCGASDALNS